MIVQVPVESNMHESEVEPAGKPPLKLPPAPPPLHVTKPVGAGSCEPTTPAVNVIAPPAETELDEGLRVSAVSMGIDVELVAEEVVEDVDVAVELAVAIIEAVVVVAVAVVEVVLLTVLFEAITVAFVDATGTVELAVDEESEDVVTEVMVTDSDVEFDVSVDVQFAVVDVVEAFAFIPTLARNKV